MEEIHLLALAGKAVFLSALEEDRRKSAVMRALPKWNFVICQVSWCVHRGELHEISLIKPL